MNDQISLSLKQLPKYLQATFCVSPVLKYGYLHFEQQLSQGTFIGISFYPRLSSYSLFQGKLKVKDGFFTQTKCCVMQLSFRTKVELKRKLPNQQETQTLQTGLSLIRLQSKYVPILGPVSSNFSFVQFRNNQFQKTDLTYCTNSFPQTKIISIIFTPQNVGQFTFYYVSDRYKFNFTDFNAVVTLSTRPFSSFNFYRTKKINIAQIRFFSQYQLNTNYRLGFTSRNNQIVNFPVGCNFLIETLCISCHYPYILYQNSCHSVCPVNNQVQTVIPFIGKTKICSQKTSLSCDKELIIDVSGTQCIKCERSKAIDNYTFCVDRFYQNQGFDFNKFILLTSIALLTFVIIAYFINKVIKSSCLFFPRLASSKKINFQVVEVKGIQEDCIICLQRLQERCAQLVCNHKFHEQCIINWGQMHNKCPICRSELQINQTQRGMAR